jgi:hypothetical protein
MDTTHVEGEVAIHNVAVMFCWVLDEPDSSRV